MSQHDIFTKVLRRLQGSDVLPYCFHTYIHVSEGGLLFCLPAFKVRETVEVREGESLLINVSDSHIGKQAPNPAGVNHISHGCEIDSSTLWKKSILKGLFPQLGCTTQQGTTWG